MGIVHRFDEFGFSATKNLDRPFVTEYFAASGVDQRLREFAGVGERKSTAHIGEGFLPLSRLQKTMAKHVQDSLLPQTGSPATLLDRGKTFSIFESGEIAYLVFEAKLEDDLDEARRAISRRVFPRWVSEFVVVAVASRIDQMTRFVRQANAKIRSSGLTAISVSETTSSFSISRQHGSVKHFRLTPNEELPFNTLTIDLVQLFLSETELIEAQLENVQLCDCRLCYGLMRERFDPLAQTMLRASANLVRLAKHGALDPERATQAFTQMEAWLAAFEKLCELCRIVHQNQTKRAAV